MMLNFKSLRSLDLGDFYLSELPDSMGFLRHLRYLNLQRTGIRRLSETIGMLYNLQVLKLEGCQSMESLLEGIGGLCNLRYLSLNGCYDPMSLLESIGGLCNLRYLNLNICNKLWSLPESIGGLCNLQCLEIQYSYPSYPRGMNRLTNHRWLHGFCMSGEGHRIELLKDMVNLRGWLEIRGLQNVVNPEDVVTANLRNKEHIKKLALVFSHDKGNDDDNEKAYCVLENLQPHNGLEELKILYYKGVRFPSWMGGDISSFSRLTRITLYKCIHCTLLSLLGQLPSLKILGTEDESNVERVGLKFWGVGFPVLEELRFEDMPLWVTWDAATRGDFPRLRIMHHFMCPKLQSMVPLYLFPALQELQIKDCGLLRWIELKSSPLLSLSLSCSSYCSSSSSSSIGPPLLVKMSIPWCPLARFSPEDEPLCFQSPSRISASTMAVPCYWRGATEATLEEDWPTFLVLIFLAARLVFIRRSASSQWVGRLESSRASSLFLQRYVLRELALRGILLK